MRRLIAAVAIPAYFSQSDVTLESAAVLLAKDLRAAQNRAAYTGDATRMEFLPDGDGYLVFDGEGRPVDNPRNELPFERRYSIDAVFRGVRITDVELGERTALQFDGRGDPDGPIRVTLQFDGDERVVTLVPPYGEIELIVSTSGWIDLGY